MMIPIIINMGIGIFIIILLMIGIIIKKKIKMIYMIITENIKIILKQVITLLKTLLIITKLMRAQITTQIMIVVRIMIQVAQVGISVEQIGIVIGNFDKVSLKLDILLTVTYLPIPFASVQPFYPLILLFHLFL